MEQWIVESQFVRIVVRSIDELDNRAVYDFGQPGLQFQAVTVFDWGVMVFHLGHFQLDPRPGIWVNRNWASDNPLLCPSPSVEWDLGKTPGWYDTDPDRSLFIPYRNHYFGIFVGQGQPICSLPSEAVDYICQINEAVL